MSEYLPTIGLEIHVELKTKTKMFCACLNDADQKIPNTNICPICMAHPGTLPVINRDAVEKVLKVGAALNAELADFTEFDRKNYFYPDIPKGYQISQYAYPLVKRGSLNSIGITRIHLEEDTARSQHDLPAYGEMIDGEGGRNISFVDYNRAGVPLMELVTEPDIHDAETASAFARELQVLLRYLCSADANMEKGEMRVEANISVSKDKQKLGTKVEVKNLNSFKSVERAIQFEVERQIKALQSGEELIQETRGWDEKGQKTFSQRKKESSEDYRYFPEPDLPKILLSEISAFTKQELQKTLPLLPSDRRNNYVYIGIKDKDADIFVRDRMFGDFFDLVTASINDTEFIKIASNYILSDLAGKREADLVDDSWFSEHTNSDRFRALMRMVQKNLLSSRGAKDTLSQMLMSNDSPELIAEREGLVQKNDEQFLLSIVQAIIEANPSVIAEYKAGKESSLQFLIGQGMKQSKGSANPGMLKNAFIKALQ